MRVMPQTVPTPRGCLVGWKAVTKMRYPIYRKYYRSLRDRYDLGTVHVADNDGRLGFGEYQSAKGLAKRRLDYSDQRRLDYSDHCMPGIHLCGTPGAAKRWAYIAMAHHLKIIPVAYSPKSIVGTKGNDTIVVYRIKVLG